MPFLFCCPCHAESISVSCWTGNCARCQIRANRHPHTHTHTHPHTQPKYCNPRCACAPRVNNTHKVTTLLEVYMLCILLSISHHTLWFQPCRLAQAHACHRRMHILSRSASVTLATARFFGGCGRLLHTVNSTSQCLLVSPVFNTVSSLHPTSFFMIFILVHIILCSLQLYVYQPKFYKFKGSFQGGFSLVLFLGTSDHQRDRVTKISHLAPREIWYMLTH